MTNPSLHILPGESNVPMALTSLLPAPVPTPPPAPGPAPAPAPAPARLPWSSLPGHSTDISKFQTKCPNTYPNTAPQYAIAVPLTASLSAILNLCPHCSSASKSYQHALTPIPWAWPPCTVAAPASFRPHSSRLADQHSLLPGLLPPTLALTRLLLHLQG